MNTIFTKNYNAPSYNINKILHYSGEQNMTIEINNLINKCINVAKDKFTYKVCYTEFPIKHHSDCIDLSFTTSTSLNLAKTLSGCSSIILFAATIGIEIDRIISKVSLTSPLEALIYQSLGTERVESLCNTFCLDMKSIYAKSDKLLRPRYSPGYGDLQLELQKDVFNALNCSKNIGLTLNNSLLMTPTKSVTAIIGVSEMEK